MSIKDLGNIEDLEISPTKLSIKGVMDLRGTSVPGNNTTLSFYKIGKMVYGFLEMLNGGYVSGSATTNDIKWIFKPENNATIPTIYLPSRVFNVDHLIQIGSCKVTETVNTGNPANVYGRNGVLMYDYNLGNFIIIMSDQSLPDGNTNNVYTTGYTYRVTGPIYFSYSTDN